MLSRVAVAVGSFDANTRADGSTVMVAEVAASDVEFWVGAAAEGVEPAGPLSEEERVELAAAVCALQGVYHDEWVRRATPDLEELVASGGLDAGVVEAVRAVLAERAAVLELAALGPEEVSPSY